MKTFRKPPKIKIDDEVLADVLGLIWHAEGLSLIPYQLKQTRQ
jgi:hypothetical protein